MNPIKVTYIGYNWRNLLGSICAMAITISSVYYLSIKHNKPYLGTDMYWSLGVVGGFFIGLIVLNFASESLLTFMRKGDGLAKQLYGSVKQLYEFIQKHIGSIKTTIIVGLSMGVIITGIVTDNKQSWDPNVHHVLRLATMFASAGLITYLYVKYSNKVDTNVIDSK